MAQAPDRRQIIQESAIRDENLQLGLVSDLDRLFCHPE
jgi:hypothetical protein